MSNPLPAPEFKKGNRCPCGADILFAPGIGPFCARTGADEPCPPPTSQPLISDPVGKDTGASLNSPLTEPDKRTTGLYEKFIVRRTDGKSEPGEKHDGCEYFVLDIDHDPHATPALVAYAKSCRADYPKLADDLDRIMERLWTLPLPASEPPTTREPMKEIFEPVTADSPLGQLIARFRDDGTFREDGINRLEKAAWDARVDHVLVAMRDEHAQALTDLQTALDASESSRRSLAGALAMKEWQPIDTAPKDGTPVLLWKRGAGMVEGWWNSGGAFLMPHWSTMANLFDPTHWMARPSPPVVHTEGA